MKTLSELTEMTGRTVLDHLDMAVDIPVTTNLVAQGDVTIIPEGMWERNGISVRHGADFEEVSPRGVTVMAGMHDHVLVAEAGAATWCRTLDDSEDLGLGIVDVATEAYLLHEEHGGIGLGAGRYCLRASREQASIIRRVAD